MAAETTAGEPGRAARDDEDHRPDRDRGLGPEGIREELDEARCRGVEAVRALGEEEPVEDLERGIEGDEGDDARGGRAGDESDRSEPDTAPGLAPGPAGPRPPGPPEGDAENRQGDGGRDVEAREDGPDVAHVGPLCIREHGGAIEPDVELAGPGDEVGQDRVRDRPQVARGEPGELRRTCPALFEGDPARAQVGRDGEGHQDQRARHGHGREAES